MADPFTPLLALPSDPETSAEIGVETLVRSSVNASLGGIFDGTVNRVSRVSRE